MNTYSIAPLFSSIIFLGLGIFVFLNKPKSSVNVSYTLWAAMTVWWQASWTVLFNTSSESLALFIVRFGYSGIIFLPMTYYHFVVEFLGLKEKRKYVVISYLVGLVFLILNWTTDLYVKGYYNYFWGFYPKVGVLHPVYMIYLSYLAFQGLYLPYKCAENEADRPIRHNQIRYVFLGNVIYCFAAIDFLVNYGIEFYPIGFTAILLSSGIFSYAIYRFRLMGGDINLTFRYATIYFFFACLVGVPLLFLNWLVRSWLFSTFSGLALVILSPWLFSKLRSKLTEAVDQLPPFRGKYERFTNLKKHEENFNQSKSVQDLAWKVIGSVKELYEPESTNILLRDESLKSYIIKAGTGLDMSFMTFMSVPFEGPVVKYFESRGNILIKELFEEGHQSSYSEQIQKEMDFIHAVVSIPVYYKGCIYAILNLDRKIAKGMYNDLDLANLGNLVRAVEHTLQALLSGLSQEQSSSVWAHDLVHIFGDKGSLQFLDQIYDGTLGPISDEAKMALRMVMKNVDFVKRHIGKLINPETSTEKDDFRIAPHSPIGVLSRTRENYTIESMKKGINLIVRLPLKSLIALFDPDMIEFRVLTNLVENAFRYTPSGGTIEIAYRLQEDYFVCYVKDTGIGLYSMASVIKAHNGRTWVESKFGEGSTFYFTIPLAR